MVCFQQTITRKSKTFVNSLCFPGLSKFLYFMKEILRTQTHLDMQSLGYYDTQTPYSKDMSYRFILRLSVLQLYNTNAWPFLMLTISAIFIIVL